MSSLIQPISSTVLHIRSKDAQQLTDNYNTNFQVQLTQAIICQPDEEVHLQLMSAEIPYSFYNISDSLENNVFKFSQEGTPFTITIPNGSYDIDELVDAFNSNSDFSTRLTMSFNEITLRITFTAVQDDLLLLFHQSNINRELGFPVLYGDEEGESLESIGDSLTSPNVVNMASVHSIFVKSNIGQGNVISTRAGNSTTLQKISVDTNSTGIIYMDSRDFRQRTISTAPVIDHLVIRITDQNDRLLQLNGCTYELSFLFEVYPSLASRRGGGRRRRMDETGEATPQQFVPPELIAPLQQPSEIPTQQEFVIDQTQPDADSTHALDGVTEAQHKANRVVLDALLEQVSKN
jgi:hypothetical protein